MLVMFKQSNKLASLEAVSVVVFIFVQFGLIEIVEAMSDLFQQSLHLYLYLYFCNMMQEKLRFVYAM